MLTFQASRCALWPRRFVLPVLCGLLLLAPAVNTRADEPTTANSQVHAVALVTLPTTNQHEQAKEAQFRLALESPTTVQFVDEPLSGVITYLSQLHGIQIVIDQQALATQGDVASSTPVTVDLKEVTLRSALDLMLGHLDLTYMVTDEVLLITTEDDASERLNTRVYSVGEIITHCGQSPDDLLDLITATVDPTTWSDVGGTGAIVSFGSTLVISQTDRTHHKIEGLLGALQKSVQ